MPERFKKAVNKNPVNCPYFLNENKDSTDCNQFLYCFFKGKLIEEDKISCFLAGRNWPMMKATEFIASISKQYVKRQTHCKKWFLIQLCLLNNFQITFQRGIEIKYQIELKYNIENAEVFKPADL